MFGTLRYDSHNNNTEFEERATGVLLNDIGHLPQHSACDKCRAKKLRCSGQKTGCDRCKVTSSSCAYTTTGDEKNLRRQKRAAPSNGEPIANPRRKSAKTAADQGTLFAQLTEADAPESTAALPPRPDTDTRNEQLRKSTEDTSSFTFPSPMPSFDGDLVMSDPGLQHMMPDSDLLTTENHILAPEFWLQTGIELDDLFSSDSALIDPISPSPDRALSYINSSSKSVSLPTPPLVRPSPAMTRKRVSMSSTAGTRYASTPTLSRQDTESTSSSHCSQSSCNCLQTSVFLLEELEKKTASIEANVLDSVLAHHKDALNHCNMMLCCPRCTIRSENMMLLAVFCEKLVALCEKVISTYLRQVHVMNRRDQLSEGSMESRQKLFFGDYRVDVPVEWDCLMRLLIILQLKSLRRLLTRMKMIASSASRSVQLSVLHVTERKVGDLMVKLWRPELESKLGAAQIISDAK